ncbi:MAG: hypothetical protein QOF01_729, partial [Thermomicrobiales bacterium]|nr:hypothetical protein [Thermomicrobiales bacterium]
MGPSKADDPLDAASDPEAGSLPGFWPARVGLDRRLSRLGWPGALVLIATLVGAFLRLFDLEGVPPAFHQDEAGPAIDAYSLLHTARDHLGHPLNLMGFEGFGDWPPSVSVLLLMPSIALFGVEFVGRSRDDGNHRRPAHPDIYANGCRLFDRKEIGVTAAWLVALLPWHVHQSRYAIQPSAVPTVVALIMLGMVWTARRQSNRAAIATAIATAAGIATYHALRVQVPLMLLVGVIAFGPRLIGMRRSILAASALIATISAIPSA